MSESLSNQERSRSSETNNTSANEQVREKLRQSVETEPRAKNKAEKSIDEIRSSINAETNRQLENKKTDSKKLTDQDVYTPTFVNEKMKKTAYKKELRKIQHKLKKRERTFSKFVHNETIEAVSNIGARTVARPSGILGGGIVAILGSSIYLWMSKNYGFTYNYFVFFILLILGFLLGVVVEAVVRPFLNKR